MAKSMKMRDLQVQQTRDEQSESHMPQSMRYRSTMEMYPDKKRK